MPLISLKIELRMETRCSNQIANELDRGPVPAGLSFAVEDYKNKYKGIIFRPVLPTAKYNCHGLTFASRRAKIIDSQEVIKVLKDDDYEVVPPDSVTAGDIVLYYKNGDIEHSGIVIRIEQPSKVPVILSKWGFLPEAIHHVNVGPYAGYSITYYRITS